MRRANDASFVLAISPSVRGFAFVVFDGPTTPIDWGMKDLRGKGKNKRALAAIRKLVAAHTPTALIVEAADAKDSRRGPRIRALTKNIEAFATTQGLPVYRYGRQQVREAFVAECAHTRPEIANVIAARIPALALRLPPVRKCWMSEDRRQSLFDAAALGTVYFARVPQGR